MSSHRKKTLFSKETVTFMVLTVATLFVFFKHVDMTPHVENDFFFSTEDPNYQADIEISKIFERNDAQILISVTGDIFDPDYQKRINYMTEIIARDSTVSTVKSITNGPKNVDDAIKSPLWQRILIADDQKSTNIVVILNVEDSPELIPRIENLIAVLDAPDFNIRISGFPYIVEQIRRHLLIDLNVFSSFAFLLFSLIVVLIFHSWRILLGMIITCINAGALTFMITHILGLKVGILTANLATIGFTLTLSHIVFLTFNWKHCFHRKSVHDEDSAVKEAIAHTAPASFWAMFTTLLGFISLLFVQARPLRELGISGAIATLVAFISAYTIYPEFLRLKRLASDWHERQLNSLYHRTFRIFDKNYATLVILIMCLIVLTSRNLSDLDTDPSLLTFFQPEGEIAEGLRFIDKNGGSSPLVLVLKDQGDALMNDKVVYKRLWGLQRDLEKHPDVGTVISLPTLLGEGKRRPFSFLISSEKIISKLEQEQYARIAQGFVSADRQYGLFLLRMQEENRSADRLEVISGLEETVRRHHFIPYLLGGIYALQGHLSQHVASSLIYGLARLILAFSVIALLVSRSIRIALAMTVSISIVPVCILGLVGYFRIPLDTISAPAANVAIAMGIDAMIHMVHAYRRLEKDKHHRLDDWIKVRRRLWEPIITSMFILCSGFGIFLLSNFPPTQRFGSAIVFGTVIAAITALFIFPLIAKRWY